MVYCPLPKPFRATLSQPSFPSSRCDRASDRTTILAFHLLIVLSHVPLMPTHLTPGSRDAIRRVLAAEEAPRAIDSPTTSPQPTLKLISNGMYTVSIFHLLPPVHSFTSYRPCHRHLCKLSCSAVPPYPEMVDPLPHPYQSHALSPRSRGATPVGPIFLPTRSLSRSSAITSSLSLQTAGARIQNVSPSSPTSPLNFLSS